tara:strand:+ start:2423 stop:2995 length:573 start_codon:yes stop_codon:yes gene_type:complete
MKIIFGLGNPGRKYKNNRHNVGFMVIDILADRLGASYRRSLTLRANIAKVEVNGEPVTLIKPLTFMNNSGSCVKRALNKYKISLLDSLVVYDDVELGLGEIRFRTKGSGAGHNGLGSIIDNLETNEINRLRIGVDKPQTLELSEYVLSDFDYQERNTLEDILDKSQQACIDWISQGPEVVMSKYNRIKKV